MIFEEKDSINLNISYLEEDSPNLQFIRTSNADIHYNKYHCVFDFSYI